MKKIFLIAACFALVFILGGFAGWLLKPAPPAPAAASAATRARPMMYLALSYDHRLIDGADAVRFLITIKDCVEDPVRMLLDL